MKQFDFKRLFTSFLLSASLVLGLTGLQYLSCCIIGIPLGARLYSGGECDEYRAIGFDVIRLYPLVDFSQPNHPEVSASIEWHIARLIVWIAVLTVCFWMIGIFRAKRKEKKQNG